MSETSGVLLSLTCTLHTKLTPYYICGVGRKKKRLSDKGESGKKKRLSDTLDFGECAGLRKLGKKNGGPGGEGAWDIAGGEFVCVRCK